MHATFEKLGYAYGGGEQDNLVWHNIFLSPLQEVSNISPLSYCRGDRPDITLRGSELNANLNQHLANCRFSNALLGLEFSME